MEALVVDRSILPEPLFSCIQSGKARVFKADANAALSPVKSQPDAGELFGMLGGGRLSSEDFIRRKAVEKEMEGRAAGLSDAAFKESGRSSLCAGYRWATQ